MLLLLLGGHDQVADLVRHRVRAFNAERRVSRSTRMHSTRPPPFLGVPLAPPLTAALAAASASALSDLPRRRRHWRFGRSTLTTVTPSLAKNRARPAP